MFCSLCLLCLPHAFQGDLSTEPVPRGVNPWRSLLGWGSLVSPFTVKGRQSLETLSCG